MIDKKRKLPSFVSDRAERKFWDRHSIEEFGDQLEDLEVQIRPARTEQIALRLYKDDLEALRSWRSAAESDIRRWPEAS